MGIEENEEMDEFDTVTLETEDAAVEMLREMAKDDGGYSDEI